MDIILLSQANHYLSQLQHLLLSEWEDVDDIQTLLDNSGLPSPIVAVEHNQVIGGLIFTHYPSPTDQQPALWINGVVVKQSHRGKAIASQLITEAVQLSARDGRNELFAYTHIPRLYSQLAWNQLSHEDGHSVMQVTL